MRRRRDRHDHRDDRRSRAVLVLALLAAFTIITLDARPGASSPVDPLRAAAGAALGPVETALGALTRPVLGLRDHLRDVGTLRAANERLAARNAALEARLRTLGVEQQRAADVERLLHMGTYGSFGIVAAQVVALGPAQGFSTTATIDAGTRDGVHPDMAVLNADGLVGRTIRADALTSTVLLVADPESVVGGRLGTSMELGFLRGSGSLRSSGRLSLELVDGETDPSVGDSVVTWGSPDGSPYVPEIPIGQLTAVHNSPRDQATTGTVRPYADLSALDVVGVVVGTGERDPRAVIDATESLGRTDLVGSR